MMSLPVEVATQTGRVEPEPSSTTAATVRVLMVAGGTGGHIFPALAVAEELRRRSKNRPEVEFEILFVGTGRGIEDRVIPAAGFGLKKIPGAGLKGIGGWRRIKNLMLLPQCAIQTALVLRDFRPQVVLGLGGYIAGPAMLLAALQGIPTVLIEPNVKPGFTNRVLAPVVRAAAVAFPETAEFYGRRARVTGNPIRAAVASVPARRHVAPFTILILGGSLGASAINDCVITTLEFFAQERESPRFIHQSGERDYNKVRQAYQDRGIPAEVHAFIEDVPAALARADLVISRAGGNAVAELAAAGKACLLIPFPGAADHHQLANAQALERIGAARVIQQEDLSSKRLFSEVSALLAAPAELERMELAARAFARPNAASEIADLVEELATKR
ncbi:MAG: undecaprenyldiphospho-muramoylpentapeptide beta-N-acetylglucosaminyltransferase [Acidobacteria bacterium]|nr:undecaprenyldiphospho-muramoylpentapeptide beta-N-acetylglucosaminyltransferase [Acidobacteriota bacterium]